MAPRRLPSARVLRRPGPTRAAPGSPAILTTAPVDTRRDWWIAVALSAGTSVLLLVLHPRIGVRDSDAVAYLTGAMSLAAGRGYVDLLGHPLNHWPPGYSWLLSMWQDPLRGSQLINYSAGGACAALLFRLARLLGWASTPALCVTAVLTTGFLRGVATNASPDVLTYAGFLWAATAWARTRGDAPGPYLAWSALIPVKLIAALFAPAGLAAAWWASGRPRPLAISAAAVGWTAAVGGVLSFNHFTAHEVASGSYRPASVASMLHFLQSTTLGLPRTWLAFWYGSVVSWPVLPAILVTVLIAVWAYAGLAADRSARPVRALGIALLGLCVSLAALVDYGGWRLIGYAAITLLLGFRPAHRLRAWPLYAAASLVLACVNARAVNSLGANDPRYAELAHAAVGAGARPGIATNSFHLLDVHQGVGSRPVTRLDDVREDWFLRVDLPAYDAVATTVWPVPTPSPGWCQTAAFPGGALFHRCRRDSDNDPGPVRTA